MDLIAEHNAKYQFFKDITGYAMLVHREYGAGLLESAYEAALKYLLHQAGYEVEQQVYLPIYWKNTKLDQNYRMDLVVNEDIIMELKSVSHIETVHRKQLWNYMRLTHLPYGMLINFGAQSLFSEWYELDVSTGSIDKIRLM